MVTTWRCGENVMAKDGNSWIFTGEPQGEAPLVVNVDLPSQQL